MSNFKGHKENNRKFPGIFGRRPDRKESRRETATQIKEHWESLSPQEQLADLDRCLGKDVGAVKQRAKIQAKIQKAKTKG